MSAHVEPAFRLADLLAALSLASDLGMGHPPEEAMRTCLLATEFARRLGLSERDSASAYWTALLMHVDASAFAHEQAAALGGDEIRVNAIGSKTDFGSARETLAGHRKCHLGEARPAERRRMGAGAAARLPGRTHSVVFAPSSLRWRRSSACITSGSTAPATTGNP